MHSQTEGAVTDGTAETLAVEEEALGAEPLHHVNPLGAEVAGVAAPEARRKVFTRHTLRDRGAGLHNQFTRMLPAAVKG